MDHSRLLFLILVVMTTSECSETAEPQCEDFDTEHYNLLEGEALYFVPYALESNVTDEEITWFKNNSSAEITTDENENVHYHGGALFFLNLLTEDSGFYTARHKDPSGECYNYYVKIVVFKQSPMTNRKLTYGDIKNSDLNKRVTCPLPVSSTCNRLKGNLNWNKDNNPLQGQHEAEFWIYDAKQKDKGLYTCICTWTHNNKEYNSSASRILKDEAYAVAIREIEIISPTHKEQLVDKDVGIKLSCIIFCGTNVNHCDASWIVNQIPVNQIDGYNQTVFKDASNNTIITAVLTIQKVSARDLTTQFECMGTSMYTTKSATLTLKQRESIIPLVTGGVCVLFFCVFAAVLIKCFAVDLTLLFRPYFPIGNYKKDTRVFDAYVVYQMQNMDKVTEYTLCQFITKVLPSVLEEKCGYRLFIHGRDDIPGEDRLELVEDRMQQSRRLMVILTPGLGSGSDSTDQHPTSPRNSLIGGFDWQVGLHHVLFQREMSVILIQLGDNGPHGYTHLPAGLQHLIQKSAPIKWPEGSRGAAAWNSRFWKRVRYLMPARPANKCPQSAII